MPAHVSAASDLRYVTRDDDRVRPQHAAWHNVVLPVDDPFWQSHFPPNGYRCRCRVIPLSQRDYERGYSESRRWTEAPAKPLSKLKPEEISQLGAEYNANAPVARTYFKKFRPPEVQFEHINQRTGEVSLVPKGISPGFAYNAGQARELVLKQMAEAKLRAAEKALADAARKAGVTVPKIAKEVADQPNWKTLERPDLRQMTPRAEAPEMLPAASSWEAAVSQLRGALGVPVGASRSVYTPVGDVTILDELLPHVVEKRLDARERYANFVIPTLMSPDEIWDTAYDDGTQRRRFIKLFTGSKYDIMVIVRQEPNGNILWNLINRDRKGMNILRTGDLIYEPPTDK
ncbi:MAG: PBECR2 nuclease fold domain-containing protein [Brachymonas sp.]|nr:PBECR2 nuclease fold domain-containing protein [Brachymonas sp.]